MAQSMSFWPLPWLKLKDDVQQDDEALYEGNPKVMVMQLPKYFFQDNVNEMTDFRKMPNGEEKTLEALMYAMLQMIQLLNDLAAGKRDPKIADHYENWGEAFLEIIPEKETPEQMRIRRAHFKVPTVEDIGDVKLHKMLSQWEPYRPISQIRIWCIIKQPNINPYEVLKMMFEDAQKLVDDFSNDEKATRKLRNHMDKYYLLSEKERNDPHLLASISLPVHERWKMICMQPRSWLDAAGTYRNENVRENSGYTASSMNSLSDRSNAGHPLSVFSPMQLVFFNGDNKIPLEFVQLSNYFETSRQDNGNYSFRFHDPCCVLKITDDLSPLAVSRRMHISAQFGVNYDIFLRYAKNFKQKASFKVVRPVPREQSRDNEMDESVLADLMLDDSDNDDDTNEEAPISLDNDDQDTIEDAYHQQEMFAEMIGGCRSDVRRPQQCNSFLIGGGVDSRKDKEFHLNTRCKAAASDPLMKLRDRAEKAWSKCEKRAAEKAEEHRDEGHEQYKSILNEYLLEEFRAHGLSYCEQLGQMVREDNDLQASDRDYAVYGAKHVVGKVLSKRTGYQVELVDNEMSFFGHLMANIMHTLETVELCADCHSCALELLISSFSCNYRGFCMLLHVLLVGGPQTSKSFLLELIQRWLVPNTAVSVRTQSQKSGTGDEHCNGRVSLDHENTLGQYAAPKGRTLNPEVADRLAKQKLLMVQCYMAYAVLQLVGNLRHDVTVITEHHTVRFDASNDTPKNVDKALLTRYNVKNLLPVEHNMKRNNKRLKALAIAKRNQPPVLKKMQTEFTNFTRTMHFLNWAVELLIELKCIKPPTLHCVTYVLNNTASFMRVSNQKEQNQRISERVELMTRELVIFHAIARLYFFPTSPYFNEPFQWRQLLDAGRYMHDTEEISMFALSMYAENFLNRVRSDVSRALLMLHEEILQNSETCKRAFGKRQDLHTVSSFMGNETPLHEESADSMFASENVSFSDYSVPIESQRKKDFIQTKVRQANAKMSLMSEEARAINASVYDWSKITFDCNVSQLAFRVKSIINRDCFKLKHTVDQIRSCLWEMSNESFSLPTYGRPEGTENTHLVTGFVQPVVDKRQHTSEQQLLYSKSKEGPVYVHYSVIDSARKLCMDVDQSDLQDFMGPKEDYSILHKAFFNMRNQFTAEKEADGKKNILATYNRDWPFLLHAIRMKPKQGVLPPTMENPFFMTQESQTMSNFKNQQSNAITTFDVNERSMIIACSPDAYCLMRHMDKNHCFVDDERLIKFKIPWISDRRTITKYLHSKSCMVYPDALLKSYEQSYRIDCESSMKKIIRGTRLRSKSTFKKQFRKLEAFNFLDDEEKREFMSQHAVQEGGSCASDSDGDQSEDEFYMATMENNARNESTEFSDLEAYGDLLDDEDNLDALLEDAQGEKRPMHDSLSEKREYVEKRARMDSVYGEEQMLHPDAESSLQFIDEI